MTTSDIHRMELMNEDLRRRCGELFLALTDVAPDRASQLSPAPEHATRYVVLDRIIDRATSLALRVRDGQPIDDELDALLSAVLANEGYWDQVAEGRAKRSEIAAKAEQTRRQKKESAHADQ